MLNYFRITDWLCHTCVLNYRLSSMLPIFFPNSLVKPGRLTLQQGRKKKKKRIITKLSTTSFIFQCFFDITKETVVI